MTEFNTLPEKFEEITLAELDQGEVAYVVPWSVWVKSNGTMGINRGFTFSKEPGGTQSIRIKRRGEEFLVDMTSLEGYKFSREGSPPHMGSTENDYLPVKFVKDNFEKA